VITDYDLAFTASAQFSECRRFRYTLRRCFAGNVQEPPKSPVIFLMLNPSTADAFKVDPTVRRCVGFAKLWGRTDLIVVNLFAIRETYPRKLRGYPDRVGEENNAVLAALPDGPIVAAWGAHPLAVERAKVVARIIGRPLHCLRRTASGAPEHPLYIPGNTTLKPWEPAS